MVHYSAPPHGEFYELPDFSVNLAKSGFTRILPGDPGVFGGDGSADWILLEFRPVEAGAARGVTF